MCTSVAARAVRQKVPRRRERERVTQELCGRGLRSVVCLAPGWTQLRGPELGM